MNYEDWDPFGIYNDRDGVHTGVRIQNGPGRTMMGVDTLVGNGVYNRKNESLGAIKEIILDMRSGRIGYAVLSFGGFLDMAEKLFAVPWTALKLDTKNKRFVLDVEKDRFEDAPGFAKGHWPDMADPSWARKIHSYYGTEPYVTGF